MKIIVHYLHNLEIQGQKKDLWKFHITFSSSPMEIPLLFQLNPGIFTCYFFNNLENSMSSSFSPSV